MYILDKPTYARPDGSWAEVTRTEMVQFIGLLIYMGIVEVPQINLYWNVRSLYRGVLPPRITSRIMSRIHFMSLTQMM